MIEWYQAVLIKCIKCYSGKSEVFCRGISKAFQGSWLVERTGLQFSHNLLPSN